MKIIMFKKNYVKIKKNLKDHNLHSAHFFSWSCFLLDNVTSAFPHMM